MNDTPTPRTSQIWGGLLVPYPFLSNCVNDTAQMEKELAAVTEQRDRLVKTLENIAASSSFDNINGWARNVAKDTLQSLNQPTP